MIATLPPGWVDLSFADVFEPFQYGLTAKANTSAAGPRLLRITDIQHGSVDWSGVPGLGPVKGDLDRYLLKRGDFLFARSGATVGKALRIDRPPEAVFASYLIRSRPRLGELADWLSWFIVSPNYWAQVRAAASGIGMPNMSAAKLRAFQVPIPPLHERRRIVDRLSALFASTRTIRAELERIGPLATHFRDRTLVAIFDENDWNTVPLAEVAETMFDGPFGSHLKSSDYVENGVRVIRLENVGHLAFIEEKRTFITESKASTLARHLLHGGDVLFSSFVDKDVRVCVMPDDLPTAAINKADVFCIRAKVDICLPDFIAYRLASPQTYDDMRGAVHGATRPRVNLSDLKRYPIPVLSVANQREIVNELHESYARSRATESEASRCLALIDKLEYATLFQAFRGELAVQDPAGDPAYDLLARIRAVSLKPAIERRKRRFGDSRKDEARSTGSIEPAATTKPRKRARDGTVAVSGDAAPTEKVRQMPIPATEAILEVLREQGASTPEFLFEYAGFTEDTIDEFYAALKSLSNRHVVVDDGERLSARV